VRSGLKPGDKVIVDNLMKLRPGAPVSLGKAPVDAKPATTTAK
jgi:membrane fusion protein (multidrug efflux system)